MKVVSELFRHAESKLVVVKYNAKKNIDIEKLNP